MNNTPHQGPMNPSDDPLLTAYALGELEPGSDDYQTIQAMLQADPSLREQVEQIKVMSDELTHRYAAASGPGLTSEALTDLAVAIDPPAAPIATIHDQPGVLRALLPYVGVAACTAMATAGIFIATQPNSTQPAGGEAVASNTGEEDVQPQEPVEVAQPVEPTAPPTLKDRFARRVTIQNDNLALSELVTLLSEVTESNIVVNWPSLELVGIDQDSLVTLNLKDVPANQVLQLVLDQVSADAFDDDKAGLRLGEEFAQIATLRDLKKDVDTRVYDIRELLTQQSVTAQLRGELMARVGYNFSGGGLFGDGGGGSGGLYGSDSPTDDWLAPGLSLDKSARGKRLEQNLSDIRDLVVRVPNFKSAPGFDLNSALSGVSSGGSTGGKGEGGLFGDDSSGGQGGSLFGDDDGDEELPTRQEHVDQITELLQTQIGNPDEWLDEESTLTELNGSLIVKTTPENHDDIRKLIDNLVGVREAVNLPAQDAEVDGLVGLLLKDFEQGLIDVEERREQRELERQWRERFATITDNPFKPVDHEPLSTFSVDVDTASYAFGRRAIMESLTLPTPDAVRIEEWINYFDYGYTAPVVDLKKLEKGRLTTAALAKLEAADETFTPFTTDVEVAQCPWTKGNKLVRVGIKAMEIDTSDRPDAHLVFLLDVSGSMRSADKLPLVQRGLPLLLDQLKDTDKVSIVVYAGASGLVLEAGSAANRGDIQLAIENLRAGGSTAGGEGIQLAYQMAQKHYIDGGINRVILCTDGDFNVGTSNTGELVKLVTEKANPKAEDGEQPQGVYLSVMGFGTGNLNDEMMEKVTNAGNGNYSYIDSIEEAVKTMSKQAGGTLITVAKDVKVQVEFNPAQVASYRLIGYENRILNAEDFNDDTVDAGDIGAGHSVTALYEVVPTAKPEKPDEQAQSQIDELRYQQPRDLKQEAQLAELMTLKLRFKPVDAAAEAGTSRKVVTHVPAQAVEFEKASEPTRFAASVAAMGMLLRGSPYSGAASEPWVIETAEKAAEFDPDGLRKQFIEMAQRVQAIQDGDLDKAVD